MGCSEIGLNTSLLAQGLYNTCLYSQAHRINIHCFVMSCNHLDLETHLDHLWSKIALEIDSNYFSPLFDRFDRQNLHLNQPINQVQFGKYLYIIKDSNSNIQHGS